MKKKKKSESKMPLVVGVLILGILIGAGLVAFVEDEARNIETCSDLLAEEVFEGQQFECSIIEESEDNEDALARGPSVKVGKNCKLHISKGVKLSCKF